MSTIDPGGAGIPDSDGRRSLDAFIGHPLIGVVVRRLLLAVPLLLAVSALSFILVSLTPGNAAKAILGLQYTPAAYAHLQHQLGLNLPLWEQYWHWLRHAVSGDLGTSVFSGQPVGQAISQRLPVTLSLMIAATVVTGTVGVSIGIFSALRGGLAGRIVDSLAMLAFAVPAFWLGAELIVIFSVKLHWLPSTGFTPISDSFTGWLRSITLPVVALALASIAGVAKQARDAMLDVMRSDYIRAGRACGLSPQSIFFRHALKNAAPSIVTFVGLQAVLLIGGTVFVENVFALPGLGSLAVSAALNHDIPVVQGLVVCFTIIVVVINLVVDLVFTWLNPKARAT